MAAPHQSVPAPDVPAQAAAPSHRASFWRSGPWWILVVGFLNVAIGQGIHQIFPVFYVAILNDLGWSRAATAAIFSVSMIVLGFSGPTISYLLQKFGFRNSLVFGALCLAVGLLGLTRVTEPWHLYVLYGVVVAFGVSMMGWQSHSIVVARWYSHMRATAVALALSGSGIGLLLLAPASQWMIDAVGWRGAAAALAVLALGLVVPNLLYMADPPGDGPGGKGKRGAGEDGLPASHDAPRRSPWADLAWRTPAFWYLWTTFLCIGFGVFSVLTHQVAHMVDMGYDPLVASGAVASIGLFSFVGRLGLGAGTDRWGYTTTILASFGLSIIGVGAMLAMMRWPIDLWLYIYPVTFGIGFGARGPIITAIGAEKFPGRVFTVTFGVITSGFGLGAAVGPWLAGWIFDRSGSYYGSFLLALAAFTIGCVTALLGRAAPRVELRE